MIKLQFINNQSVINSIADEIASETKLLADTVYTEVRKNTPVDTGRAKSGWKKEVKSTGFDITNDVPYIGILDKGRHMTPKGMRGSKQAPKGIIGPSLNSIKGKN